MTTPKPWEDFEGYQLQLKVKRLETEKRLRENWHSLRRSAEQGGETGPAADDDDVQAALAAALVAQRFDEAIVQRVAFGRAAQTHHGHSALHLQGDSLTGCAFENGVVGVCHAGVLKALDQRAKKVIIDNHIVSRSPNFSTWWFP